MPAEAEPGVKAQGNINANGDRLPTRERGYRSANHYVRRRTTAAMPFNSQLNAAANAANQP